MVGEAGGPLTTPAELPVIVSSQAVLQLMGLYPASEVLHLRGRIEARIIVQKPPTESWDLQSTC